MKNSKINFQNALLRQLVKLQAAKQGEGGYVLVAAVIMIVILLGLFTTAAIVGRLESASTDASEDISQGFFSAEAGLNLRANQIRQRFEGFSTPRADNPNEDNSNRVWQDCLDNNNNNDGSGDFECDTSFTINGHQLVTYVNELNGGNPRSAVISEGSFTGLSAQEFQYDVLSVALDTESEAGEAFPSAILGMRFTNRLVPLFQFAVFYENDAEFSIPPNMTLNGRVHSNNDLYLNSAGNNFSLNIFGSVTTTGDLYRGGKSRVNPAQVCAGNVRIERETGGLQSLNCDGGQRFRYNNGSNAPSNISQWGDRINIGIPRLEVPDVDSLDPDNSGIYWRRADLRVALIVDNNGNPTDIEIQDENGNRVNSRTSRLLNSCNVPSATLSSLTGGYRRGRVRLDVQSRTGNFRPQDALTIGDDIDSNVINRVRNGGNRLFISRRLGHGYQPNPVIPEGNTPAVRKAVVSTSDTFFNYREKDLANFNNNTGDVGNSIRMLDVNVEELLRCARDENLLNAGRDIDDDTDGGLVIFFTIDGPGNITTNVDFTDGPGTDDPDTPADEDSVAQDSNANVTGSKFGIRLYNAANLAVADGGGDTLQGLTVVSDQAVYVQGDYNHDENAFDPQTGQYDDNIYDKKPAAILADSINVLSTRWQLDDSNARAYVNNQPQTLRDLLSDNERTPGETFINAAFLSGTEIAGGRNGAGAQGGEGSGGVNNYPRFHENWAAAPVAGVGNQICDRRPGAPGGGETRTCLNYRGSLVSLGEPRRVNSPFCGSGNENRCNIYTPPVRNWDYDTDFDNAGELPPLSPRAVFLVQELFERSFDQVQVVPNNTFAQKTQFGVVQSLFASNINAHSNRMIF